MTSDASRPSAAVLAAASDWFGRRDGGITPAEEAEFKVWLSVPEHARAYGQLERIWGKLPLAARKSDGLVASSPARSPIRFALPALLAAAAAIAGVLLVRRPSATQPTGTAAQHETTAIGQQRQIVLSDGSIVLLNTGSVVDISYRADARLITLQQGEAHFQVAKNHRRPFIVTAAGATVRAVGTAFDVWIRPSSVEVTVNEGIVKVDATTDVAAGSRADIVVAGGHLGTPVVTPLDAHGVAQALAWRENLLEMGPTPLREWVDQFNRYNSHRLLIADPAIGSLRIGGSFRTQDYAAFVRVLEENFGVRARKGQDATWLEKAQ